MNLINFVTFNELDLLLLSITVLVNVITSFFILKLIINNNKESNFIKKIDRNFYAYYGYFCYLQLFIFGIFLIINSIINKINIIYLLIGIMLVLFFIYVTINYIIKRKNNK
ncbi:MAG: hypothetical protein J1F35_02250 [Erysipelotrichales bacterium]|nr:hypothetical protein [Erysipelotrichales bacterium]